MPFSVTPEPATSVVVPVPACLILIGFVCAVVIVAVLEAALFMRKYVLPSLSAATVPTVYDVPVCVLIVGVKLVSKPLVNDDVVA